MAESFSVKAILSAADRGFTSTMKAASGCVDHMKTTLKSGIGFGVMMAAGQAAFNTVTNGVTGLIGEMNDASAAWKTFQGNMEMNGHTAKEIRTIKGELQAFAEATIYSSSDMASTFAQLEAVGTKNTTKLVKGFGGLAAAAENPTQAMKTLSQQATQMAAKPTVAWEDFKLMLEQTPAGIAAVAKEMGMSTQDMIKDVQAGKLATEDFFDAIAKVGTNDSFTKLATQYKTVGQAMDGLTETAANKLQPAFNVLSAVGISAVSRLVDKLGELDGEKIAAKLTAGLDKIKPYWDTLVGTAKEVGSAFGDAFSAISGQLAKLNGSFGSTESVEGFGDAIDVAAGALKAFAGFLEDHADMVALLIDNLPKLLVAYMAFKAVKAVAPGLAAFGGALDKLAGGKIGSLSKKLLGTAKAQKEIGDATQTTSGQISSGSKAFTQLGAGVALLSAGFYLLAKSAIALADAGGPAIAIFSGMAVAVTALGLGMMYMLSNIKSTPKQMTTLGNSFLKASAGIALITLSLSALALALVPLGELGSTAVPALAAFGVVVAGLAVTFGVFGSALKANMAGVIAFAASISVLALAMTPIASTGTQGAIAMAAFGVVVAGLVVVFGLFGSALTAAIPAMLVFGATILMVGAGMDLASSFITALVPLVKQLGETFALVGDTMSNVAISVGEALTLVSDGVATVVDAISGGFAKVLDSIAGVIESIGVSAKNAGVGFESVASGIETISGLSIGDIAKSLAAVAAGLASISSSGADLPSVAAGMQLMVSALMLASACIGTFNSGMRTMSSMTGSTTSSLQAIKNAFANFSITPPNIGPVTAAFARIIAQARTLVPGLTSAGQSAGQGLARGLSAGGASAQRSVQTTTQAVINTSDALPPQMEAVGLKAGTGFSKTMQSGMTRAVSVVRSAKTSINSVLRSVPSSSYSSGRSIGQGLANGMRSTLGIVRSAAAQLAAAADAAIRAKAKIHSPSRVSKKDGAYLGKGWVLGVLSKVREAKQAALELFHIPEISVPSFELAYSTGSGSLRLNDDYDYNRKIYVYMEVPVEVEGREIAKASAEYMQDELDKRQTREDRKHGRT